MNLTIYDQFAQIKSIRKLQNFSTEILLALFLSILVLVTLIVVIFEPIPTDWLDEMRWLLNWLRWGMVLMFFAIGIAIKSIWHIVFAEIYGLLSWSLSQDIFIPNLLPDSKFVLVIGIFLLGGFFLSLVDYQIIQIDNLISRILNKVRNGELEEIDSVVANLRGKINENNIFQSTNNQGSNYKDELVLISSIEQLVSLKGILSSVQVNRLLLRRVSELLFPILTSVFFPILVNSLINMLKGIVP